MQDLAVFRRDINGKAGAREAQSIQLPLPTAPAVPLRQGLLSGSDEQGAAYAKIDPDEYSPGGHCTIPAIQKIRTETVTTVNDCLGRAS